MSDLSQPIRAYRILAPLGFAAIFLGALVWNNSYPGLTGVLVAYVLFSIAAYYLYVQFSARPVLAWSVSPGFRVQDLPAVSKYTIFLGCAFVFGLTSAEVEEPLLSTILFYFWWLPFGLLSIAIAAISISLQHQENIPRVAASSPPTKSVGTLESVFFFVIVYSTLLFIGSTKFLGIFDNHIPKSIPQLAIYIRIAILAIGAFAILVEAFRLFHLTEDDIEREISPRLLAQSAVDSKSALVVVQMFAFYGITTINATIFLALYCVLVGREFARAVMAALKTLASLNTLVCVLYSISLMLALVASMDLYKFWKICIVFFDSGQRSLDFYARICAYIFVLAIFSWIGYFVETFGGSRSSVRNIGIALASLALGCWLCALSAHLLSIFGVVQILSYGLHGLGIFSGAIPGVMIVGVVYWWRRKEIPGKSSSSSKAGEKAKT